MSYLHVCSECSSLPLAHKLSCWTNSVSLVREFPCYRLYAGLLSRSSNILSIGFVQIWGTKVHQRIGQNQISSSLKILLLIFTSMFWLDKSTLNGQSNTSSTRTRRGGSCLKDIYKTFLIYRTCMRRAPAKPVRACTLRNWCLVSHVTLEAPRHTSHLTVFTFHTALFTLHPS